MLPTNASQNANAWAQELRRTIGTSSRDYSTVNLWVDCDDRLIQEFGPQTPSSSSRLHGQSFLQLFREADHDFYAMDKALFSPAVVVFHNLKTGNSFRFGTRVRDLLHDSFGM